MKIRFLYHKSKDSWLGKGIIVWTWVLAAFYSVPKLFKKPPKGSSRWKEYVAILKLNFSHVSVWFPDENGIFTLNNIGAHADTQYAGQCFSSTTRGDSKGVRFAPASEVLHHPERWMYQEYEVADKEIEAVMPLLKLKVGNPYDYDAIKGFFLPWETQNPDAEMCSEACGWFAWIVYIVTWTDFDPWGLKISPRRLAKVLGGELHELKGE